MSDDPNGQQVDNTAIRSLRDHVGKLESQLSEAKITYAGSEAEKQQLAQQKQLLETELENAKAQLTEKESIKARADELEGKFKSFVDAELETFPEAQREQAKVLIEGLSPDKALDQLKALKTFVTPTNVPKAGDPPPGPKTPSTKPNDPPAPNPNEDKMKEMREAVARGVDPLSLISLSTQ